MIDLVLRNVLQYLPIPDLCSCRLVCKLWNTEAGAYVRRKQRIVFSPNSVEKMANFTAFMKAQIEESEEGSYDDEDYNDNFDKSPSPHHHRHHPHPHQHKDSSCSSSTSSSSVISLDLDLDNRTKLLPAYTDFSFTAQFPRINFSRQIVREFSHTYGQYVKKLEIFYPNDSSLSAKDFRQFFLQGMPHVQYIHFVNLPSKLTQSSFLPRSTRNTRRLSVKSGDEFDDDDDANSNNHNDNNFSGARSITDNRSSDSSHNSIRNNNTIKDRKLINRNRKDDADLENDQVSHHHSTNPNKFNHNDNKMEEEDKKKSNKVIRHHPQRQDCSFRWDSLIHLKIDRTLLIEVAWSNPFLEDLFSTMPNLKHYELWTWNTTGGDGHSNPYFTCLTQSQRANLASLCPGSVGESLLTSLAGYGLTQLKKLHLPVFSGEVSAQSVELLLSELKGTLEELQVNCSSMQDSRMIHFPRMEKLLVLHMIISVPWKNVYTLFTPSIEYQSQFPVLETLKLELAVYHDFGFIHYFFPSSGSIFRTLKELDISFSGYRDDKFIGIVAKIFPNLQKLRLDGYGNRILGSICLYLQNLEYFEMYLIYGFNVDDQLTGIDRKICNEIRKCERYLDFKMDEAQLLSSLANLSKLKTLKIKQKDYQAKFWPQAQCITDITGYFALARIKTLRHLLIESVKFSPECRQYLATTLEDCWLDFL